jgi:signal transduction histidine kinase
MKMKFTFILIFSAVHFLSSASPGDATFKNVKIDSLRQIIMTLKDDRDKADNLLLLAQAYYDSQQFDSAKIYADKAGSLSQRLNYPQGIAEACFKQSFIYYRNTDYNAALPLAIQYIKLIKPLNDIRGLSKGYLLYGNLLKQRGEIDSAIYYFRESLSLSYILKDTLRYIAINNSIGNIFQEVSKFDSAVIYYLKTIRLCEVSGRESILGKIYKNLGATFICMEQYDKAEEYLLKSLEINRKNNDDRTVVLNLNCLGSNCIHLNEPEQALKYYDEAESLSGKIHDSIALGDIFNSKGLIFFNQKDYIQALKNYNKAIEIYRRRNYYQGLVVVLVNKSDIYFVQGKYKEALALNDSALALSVKYKYDKTQKNALQNISDIYKSMGNFRNAYEYLTLLYNLKDSIFNIDKQKLIGDLTMKYEKEKDQAQILVLEKENLQKDLSLRKRTIQRNAYLFTGITIIALTLFFLLYYRQRAIKDKIIAEQKIIQLEEEKKLMAAESLVEGQEEERKRIAIDLHDGLGVLLSAAKMQFTSIHDTNPANLPIIERASHLLEQASNDVRKISYNMMPGLLTKLGLYEAVEDLIENINDQGTIKAQCEISENVSRLPENKEIMLYRIIQEMVNNTIRHSGARNIRLQIMAVDDNLHIHYSDDGKGFDVEKTLGSKSIGLNSIRSRVNFLKGNLTIDSKPDEGVNYFIRVPVTIALKSK